MSLLLTTNPTLQKIVDIIEEFPASEQEMWLKALQRQKLLKEAGKLKKSIKKAPQVTVMEIVAEVNKHRKEHGYKAYSV
jgi:hypothetical protein